jgi:acetyltransferase-like isoleucine patch superfamily enzyme
MRFRAWVARLRVELRRRGSELEVDAPYGVLFDGPPIIKVYPSPSSERSRLELRVGRGVRIGRDLTLEIYAQGTNRLELGDGVDIHNNVRLLLRNGSIALGTRSRVRDGVLLKSDGIVTIGEAVTLGPYGAIHCTERITLDDLVGLGERVSIIDSDHTFDGVDIDFLKKPLATGPIRLGRGTMVAIGSVILRGADVGPNSAIAANSVVRGGEYGEASLLAGNPAKTIRQLRAAESEH